MKHLRLRMYSPHTRRDTRCRLRHATWRINQILRSAYGRQP